MLLVEPYTKIYTVVNGKVLVNIHFGGRSALRSVTSQHLYRKVIMGIMETSALPVFIWEV